MKDLGINIVLCFIIISCCTKCEPKQQNIFKYCTNKEGYCLYTPIDTASLIGNFFQSYPSVTVIKEYDPISKVQYTFAYGSLKPSDDYNPFNTYSYDTSYIRKKLKGRINQPVYFIKLENYNQRDFVTVCKELPRLGIIIESNFYSDTLNILIETTYYNIYNISNVDIKKHYDILRNSVVLKK